MASGPEGQGAPGWVGGLCGGSKSAWQRLHFSRGCLLRLRRKLVIPLHAYTPNVLLYSVHYPPPKGLEGPSQAQNKILADWLLIQPPPRVDLPSLVSPSQDAQIAVK